MFFNNKKSLYDTRPDQNRGKKIEEFPQQSWLNKKLNVNYKKDYKRKRV